MGWWAENRCYSERETYHRVQESWFTGTKDFCHVGENLGHWFQSLETVGGEHHLEEVSWNSLTCKTCWRMKQRLGRQKMYIGILLCSLSQHPDAISLTKRSHTHFGWWAIPNTKAINPEFLRLSTLRSHTLQMPVEGRGATGISARGRWAITLFPCSGNTKQLPHGCLTLLLSQEVSRALSWAWKINRQF